MVETFWTMESEQRSSRFSENRWESLHAGCLLFSGDSVLAAGDFFSSRADSSLGWGLRNRESFSISKCSLELRADGCDGCFEPADTGEFCRQVCHPRRWKSL